MQLFRKKVLSPQEQVTQAIDKLERSNSFIVKAAHAFAFVLIIATSVTSLISLAADALKLVIADGGNNVPNDASVAITVLLVLAMDTGMVLAATYYRIGRERGEGLGQLWGHVAIMITVAMLEAGTYAYMLFLYEKPANILAGVLIIARAIAVPILSLYLALASEITVTTSDIARLTEVFSGIGLLRQLVTEAHDPSSALGKKVGIYRAAATLSEAQRAKLNGIYEAVTGQSATTPLLPPGDTTEEQKDDQEEEKKKEANAPSQNGNLGFGVFSPELREYELPDGLTLTTMDSKKNIAKMLGIKRQQIISEAMIAANMSPAGAATGQPRNAENVAIWQILSLVESGLIFLDMVTKVKKVAKVS